MEKIHKPTTINLPDKVSEEIAETILQILTEHHFMIAKLLTEINGGEYDEQVIITNTIQASLLDRLGYDRKTSTRFLEKFINKLSKDNNENPL